MKRIEKWIFSVISKMFKTGHLTVKILLKQMNIIIYIKIQKNQETDNKDLMNKKSIEEIKKELQHLTEQLNREISPLNTGLEFKYNDKIDNFSVFVIDKQTDKVIREIPSKDALKLMEKMKEFVGMLFDKKG